MGAKGLILAFIPVMLACPRPPTWQVATAGLAIGALTGFFGVGGGFIVVPVQTLGFGMGFRHAVATSLVIITLTGPPRWRATSSPARRRTSH